MVRSYSTSGNNHGSSNDDKRSHSHFKTEDRSNAFDFSSISTALKWIGGGIVALAVVTSPWTIPLLQTTQRMLTAEDEVQFERSKHNSDTQIDYQRAMRDQVLVEVQPKTWCVSFPHPSSLLVKPIFPSLSVELRC